MKHKKGVVLAYVLIFLLVLVVLGFALGSSGIFSLSRSFQIQNSTSALYAAQAGIADEVYDIEENQLSPLSPICGYIYNSTTDPSLLSTQTLTNNAQVMNQEIVANYSLSCSAPVPAPDGTSIPPGMAYLSAVGSMNGTQREANQIVQVEPFNFSIFLACSSCNSSFPAHIQIGTYQGTSCGGTGVVSSGGSLGTNSNLNPAITFNGGSPTNVQQVVVGPGGTVNPSAVSTNMLSAPLPIPTYSDPLGGYGTSSPSSGTLSPGQYGNINVSSSMTLDCNTSPPSNFSIESLTSSSTITLGPTCSESNPATLYIYNSINLSGSAVLNNNQNPSTLIIYGMPTLTSITISGTSSGSFALYAPQANITINGGGSGIIYGSFLGNQITVNGSGNASYNFDQCLENDPLSPFAKLPRMVFSKSWFTK